MTIAYKENEILERYFPTTMAHSSFRWSVVEKRVVPSQADLDAPFLSPVSKELITRLDERSMFGIFAGLTLFLVVAGLFAARRK